MTRWPPFYSVSVSGLVDDPHVATASFFANLLAQYVRAGHELFWQIQLGENRFKSEFVTKWIPERLNDIWHIWAELVYSSF